MENVMWEIRKVEEILTDEMSRVSGGIFSIATDLHGEVRDEQLTMLTETLKNLSDLMYNVQTTKKKIEAIVKIDEHFEKGFITKNEAEELMKTPNGPTPVYNFTVMNDFEIEEINAFDET